MVGDHVAAAALGEFVINDNYHPLDVWKVGLPETSHLFFVIVTPDLNKCSISKRESENHTLKLISSVAKGDLKMLVCMLSTEGSARSNWIPGFKEVINATIHVGSLGFRMSGSSPTVVGVTDNDEEAFNITAKMVVTFDEIWEIKASAMVRTIDRLGCRVTART
ncbi:homoserine kinase-like [Magnolia sinica]|uniref:homoserine kinase-like n=1 Tax=Magnolia sinica TaxID=86752 RepID=UPI00265997FE|nr:homoserine kinase-like [Magnolia sinica]